MHQHKQQLAKLGLHGAALPGQTHVRTNDAIGTVAGNILRVFGSAPFARDIDINGVHSLVQVVLVVVPCGESAAESRSGI